jgi:hypothetical protein
MNVSLGEANTATRKGGGKPRGKRRRIVYSANVARICLPSERVAARNPNDAPFEPKLMEGK